jgi:hypothetical protein
VRHEVELHRSSPIVIPGKRESGSCNVRDVIRRGDALHSGR